MTVYLTGYAPKFVGLAADPKPTLEANSTRALPPGSEFLELDGYKKYVFDGVSAWYAITTSSF
jgi:hypothetical protein